MLKWEPVESRRWRNTATGATASIYGAVPWVRESDRSNWIIETVGWTVKNNHEGTVGCGRRPWDTLEEAQAFCDRWN